MRRFRFAIAAAAAIALCLTALPANAAERSTARPPQGSIVDVAVAASGGGTPDNNPWDYDILVQALLATGLAPVLADTSKTYTVFAPNDEAFLRLVTDLTGTAPASEAAALTTITQTFTTAQISNILLYHVVAGKKLGPLQVLFSRSITMANGGNDLPARDHPARRDSDAARSAPGAHRDQHPGIQRRHPHDRPRPGAGSAVAVSPGAAAGATTTGQRRPGNYADDVTTSGRDDEGDLAARFRAGDESALREAYARWSPLVFRLAHQSLGNRDDADEATQSVFVSAWQARERFDPDRGELGGWIVGITRHRVADLVEANSRRARLLVALRAESVSDEPAPADPAQTAMIEEELARLGEVPRRVVELSYYDRLSHAQIAEELGIPIGTVKSHLRRSIARIRVDWEVEDDTR